MQIQKSYRIVLLVICLFLGISSIEAAYFKENNTPNPKNPTTEQLEKGKVKIFLKSIFSKPKTKSDDEVTLWSNLAFWIGLGSLVLMILGFAINVTALLGVAAVAGLVGFFICIKSFKTIKSSDNPQRYSGEKIKTTVGIICSLFGALFVPIGLAILILALLSI